MVNVNASVFVHTPPSVVWDIIVDLDAEPTYWKGTKSIRNISADGDVVRREVTIAFRDKRCLQTVRLQPPHAIHYEFTKGIIQGSKRVTATADKGGTILAATWDIRLTGMMGMFSGAIAGHIREGTQQALESIKRAAEANALECRK